MTRDGMTEEEAQEWYEFNILGAYCGEGMPVFLIKGDRYLVDYYE